MQNVILYRWHTQGVGVGSNAGFSPTSTSRSRLLSLREWVRVINLFAADEVRTYITQFSVLYSALLYSTLLYPTPLLCSTILHWVGIVLAIHVINLYQPLPLPTTPPSLHFYLSSLFNLWLFFPIPLSLQHTMRSCYGNYWHCSHYIHTHARTLALYSGILTRLFTGRWTTLSLISTRT